MSDRPMVVVDDDIDHAVIMSTVIAGTFPRAPLLTFTDPAGIAPRLTSEAPHGALVMIDRMLGQAESFEVVRDVTRARPDLTVVMMSAVIDPEDRRRALECGASEAVEKPGSLPEWRALIVRLGAPAPGAARLTA